MVSRQKTGAVYTVTTAREFRLRGLGPGVTNRKAKACFSAAMNNRLQTNGYKLFKKGRLWASLIADFRRPCNQGLHAGFAATVLGDRKSASLTGLAHGAFPEKSCSHRAECQRPFPGTTPSVRQLMQM